MTAYVVPERTNTGRRVVVAIVVFERASTDGRVRKGVRVVLERVPTDSRVADAAVVQERVLPEEGVKVDGIAAFLANGSRLRR